MLDIEAGRLTESLAGLASFVTMLNAHRQYKESVDADPESFRRIIEAVKFLGDTGKKLGIVGADAAADILLSKLPLVPVRDGKHIFGEAEYFMLKEVFNGLLSSMNLGLNSFQCLILNGSESALFKAGDYPFGKEVFENFGSANEDISEAAKCLALQRGTACVMHLNRALEVALIALGSALKIGKQNDWGSWLRKIKEELEARFKAAGARTLDEQFYSEAAFEFEALKRAWRNPSMHVDRTYSPERANEIFNSVRSFMRHLATRISEKSP